MLGQARIPDGGFTSKWKGISFRNSSPAWVGKRLFAAPSRKQLQEVSCFDRGRSTQDTAIFQFERAFTGLLSMRSQLDSVDFS